MKKLTLKYSNLYTYLLAFFLFGIALFVSALINNGFIKTYFPYTAVILLAIATWILYRRESKSLNEIDFNFKLKNILLIPLGIVIAAATFLLAKYLRALCLNETINLAAEIDYKSILTAFYFILPTVAVEEFLFRGYLFKKTIELSSVVKANIIFSILFTLIHVLDDTVLNSPGKLVLLTISIPVGHLLFATALIKSKSIYFPIGLHLGNNWATRHLVSTSNETSIFHVTNTANFDTWFSFILFLILWNCIFLFVTFLIWKWDKFSFFKNKKKTKNDL